MATILDETNAAVQVGISQALTTADIEMNTSLTTDLKQVALYRK